MDFADPAVADQFAHPMIDIDAAVLRGPLEDAIVPFHRLDDRPFDREGGLLLDVARLGRRDAWARANGPAWKSLLRRYQAGQHLAKVAVDAQSLWPYCCRPSPGNLPLRDLRRRRYGHRIGRGSDKVLDRLLSDHA
jgi:hypothetical protein